MTYSHRCIAILLLHHQLGHRLANDVRTAKHNALLAYMKERPDENLKGGVIVEKNDVWYYCKYAIQTTSDVTGWDAFFPDEYN